MKSIYQLLFSQIEIFIKFSILQDLQLFCELFNMFETSELFWLLVFS